MRSKNFAFVRNIDKKLFSNICDIEYYSYLNPRDAAQKCRIVLETIVDDLMAENGIDGTDDLGKKLSLLRDGRLKHPRPTLGQVIEDMRLMKKNLRNQ